MTGLPPMLAMRERGSEVPRREASIDTATLHPAIERPVRECAAGDSIAASVRSILMIDDNPDDREAFRRALMKADESCLYLEAGDGPSGIASIAANRPDCVLLDYSLPGLSGLAVLRRIRDIDAFLPVIMLTGQGSEAIAIKAMKNGAQNYLVKTALTSSVLHRAIVAATDHASFERQIHEQRRQIHTQRMALAESGRLNTAILRSAGMMIIATGSEGGILTFNPAAEIALGYGAEEVIGEHTPALW